MSIENKIDELIAAINANTAALKGTGGSAPASTTKTTKPAKDEPKGYEAKHTKSDMQAAANEVKEKLGVSKAKALIKEVGAEKLADITKAEDIDKLYDLCKEALGEGGDTGGDI